MSKILNDSTTRARWLNWPVLAVFSLVLAACGGPSNEQKMLTQTAQQIIVPLYSALQTEAGGLASEAEAFCEAPDAESLTRIQQQWRLTMQAWAGVQPIDFGPLEDGNLRWKLHFWPDRRDITRKKVEALIAGTGELTSQGLGEQSVSVQGLAAVEYLLFDKQGGQLARYQQDDSRPCDLLQAITRRIEQVSGMLVEQWAGNGQQPGFADVFSKPGPDNERYPDDRAALAALFGSLVVGTEVVKRNKLGIAIDNGKGADKIKPYRLEAWRSQYSLALMKASMTSLEHLYRGGDGYGLADYLAEQPQVEAGLLSDIDRGFAAVNKQFAKLSGPLFEQLGEPHSYDELAELYRQLGALEKSLSQLPERLQISLGFNSNDGD